MMELQERWNYFTEGDIPALELRNAIFQQLQTHYQESHRQYHNFLHIEALFEKAEELYMNWEKPKLVAYAIWFHDVIYDPTRTDNEEASAKFAIDVLSKKSSLTQSDLTTIEQLILATATHSLIIDSVDCRNFLDLDLSILGEPWEQYETYAQQIRQEYQHVSWERYCLGRKQVLEKFLKRDQIYYSELFQGLCEEQARKNLKREIDEVLIP